MAENPRQSSESRGRTVAIVVLALVVLALGTILLKEAFISGKPIACPEDAKICPDGSSVGRLAPNCEFAPCPTGAQIANPASEYCEILGGNVRIIQEEPGPDGGGSVGLCDLPGGETCEEWTLFRGECPGYPPADGANSSPCSVDADCVPNGACHPSSCINRESYVDPGPIACTAACLGPLDCGAGSCKCVSGSCQVVSNG